MSRTIPAFPPALTTLLFTAGSRAVLLLEGDDDHGVFKIWLSERRDRIEFFVAGERFKVEGFVRQAREKGWQRAFGIVDRDYTAEADYTPEPEPGLLVLSRHELENYVVEPETIRKKLEVLRSPELPPSVEEIAQELDDWTADSLSRVAANWLLAPPAKTLLPDKGREPRSAVLRHLADELGIDEAAAEEKLKAKEDELRPLLEDRTRRHTLIEGKRLLSYTNTPEWFARLGGSTTNELAAAGGIPAEIQRLVEGRILAPNP